MVNSDEDLSWEEIEILPRNERTPAAMIPCILANMRNTYESLYPEMVSAGAGFQKLYSSILESKSTGDEAAEDFMRTAKASSEGVESLSSLIVAMRFLVDAERQIDTASQVEVWSLIADAQYWWGAFIGAVAYTDLNGRTALAKRGARARHKGDYETAELIKAWYKANHKKYKSMDKAAGDAEEEFEVEWRTARKHIGVAKKEMIKAGKANKA